MADSGSDSEPEKTIAEDIVVTKYKMAGDMANRVLQNVIKRCIDGAKAIDICKYGDDLIVQETGKVYKKEKEMPKGIAFPTCISVNNCVCHYSPLESEKDVVLKDGDVVKVDLAAHVDGFIGSVATTIVIGATIEKPVTGRKADVLMAAHLCSEAALRIVKAGNSTGKVTKTIQTIAESFNCKPVEGMLSHQLQQNRIDGEKTIIQNPTEKQRLDHEENEFGVHEVYAVDMIISSGEARPRELDTRTSIYKRNPEIIYQLKMKASRALYSEVEKKYTSMCFTLRALEDERKAKMGVMECVKHELLTPFPVMYDKEGDFVAQFKFTVLLMPNMPLKITGGLFDPNTCKSEFTVKDEEITNLLNTSISRKAAKKKKKKAATKAVQESNAMTTEVA